MKSADDGGPAFPRHQLEDVLDDEAPGGRRQTLVSYAGMSLRDYFAAKAMHAELVTAGALEGPRDALVEAACVAEREIEDQVAFNAYKLADAMIAQRKKLVP